MIFLSFYQRSVAWLRTKQRWGWPLAIAAAATLALSLHTLRYPKFFFDDSFISLRYADRLRSGLGLTWTDGERVEGYTNFLWVVAVALVGLFRRAMIMPTRVLGVVCMAFVALAAAYAHRPRRPSKLAAAAFPGFALAALGPIAAWSVGGLEHPLLMALLTWAIVLIQPAAEGVTLPRSRLLCVGTLLGLASLTRPDGIMLAGCVCGGVVLARSFRAPGWRAGGIAGGVALAFTAVHTLFRKIYYDAWVPNTSSKLSFSRERLEAGLKYLAEGAPLWTALLALALVALALMPFDARLRRRAAPIALPLLAWSLYVAAIGGDFMPQRRHVVPSLVLLCLLGAEALAWAMRRGPTALALAWAAAIFVPGHLVFAQRKDWQIADANNTGWYWAGRPIGTFFRAAFGQHDPLLAVDAAGALPYFSRLRAIDMLGLNDRWIARHPPPSVGGVVAHDLGDGPYVMSRKPDLVVFHLPFGSKTPMWRSGKQMQATAEFKQLYQLVHYEALDPLHTIDPVHGVVWVRRDDSRIGFERTPCQLLVPGYLLASSEQVPASFEDDKLGTRVPEGREAAVERVPLPGGMWRVTADATNPVKLWVRPANGSEATGVGPLLIHTPDPWNSLTVKARHAGPPKSPPAHVRALVFRRTDDAGHDLPPSDPRCTITPPPGAWTPRANP